MPIKGNFSLSSSAEKSFRDLANSAPFLIWLSGTDKKCYWFNKSWLDFTGKSMEQEVGDGWLSSVHPKDKDHCLSVYESSFDQRIDFRMTYRLLHHDGTYHWIDDVGSPRFINSTFEGYIGSCIDVSLTIDWKQEKVIAAPSFSNPITCPFALTKKESEVLNHLANGLLVHEIADLLGISHHTVIHHKKSIFHKLGTTSALKTVNLARKFNLIQ